MRCKIGQAVYTLLLLGKSGARGRNRTTDTRIFKDRVEWVRRSLSFVKKKFGAENILSAYLHDDEKTSQVIDISRARLNVTRFPTSLPFASGVGWIMRDLQDLARENRLIIFGNASGNVPTARLFERREELFNRMHWVHSILFRSEFSSG